MKLLLSLSSSSSYLSSWSVIAITFLFLSVIQEQQYCTSSTTTTRRTTIISVTAFQHHHHRQKQHQQYLLSSRQRKKKKSSIILLKVSENYYNDFEGMIIGDAFGGEYGEAKNNNNNKKQKTKGQQQQQRSVISNDDSNNNNSTIKKVIKINNSTFENNNNDGKTLAKEFHKHTLQLQIEAKKKKQQQEDDDKKELKIRLQKEEIIKKDKKQFELIKKELNLQEEQERIKEEEKKNGIIYDADRPGFVTLQLNKVNITKQLEITNKEIDELNNCLLECDLLLRQATLYRYHDDDDKNDTPGGGGKVKIDDVEYQNTITQMINNIQLTISNIHKKNYELQINKKQLTLREQCNTILPIVIGIRVFLFFYPFMTFIHNGNIDDDPLSIYKSLLLVSSGSISDDGGDLYYFGPHKQLITGLSLLSTPSFFLDVMSYIFIGFVLVKSHMFQQLEEIKQTTFDMEIFHNEEYK